VIGVLVIDVSMPFVKAVKSVGWLLVFGVKLVCYQHDLVRLKRINRPSTVD
jgi:hypothetical protein